MSASETTADSVAIPRVTVAAVVERQGRFLLVEERLGSGELVINQPAGHLEAGESLVEAVIRETREETGWKFIPQSLVGVYQWCHPSESKNFVRFAICGSVTHRDESPQLDVGIERVIWLSVDDLRDRTACLRSPLVLACVRDYLSGERFPLTVIKALA